MALTSLVHSSLCLLVLSSSGSAVVSPQSDELTVAKLEELRDGVLSDVESLRGNHFNHPVAVKVTSKAGFLEYVQARTEASQTKQERRAEEQAAKLLGLIPPNLDMEATMFGFLQDQVGGFYDPTEETFYVMETLTEPGVLRMILVHELTHALDDQLFGIDEIQEPLLKVNSDAAIAFHSVVEGSGTTVMQQWMLPKLMAKELSMAEIQKASGSMDFGDLPEYLWIPLIQSYVQGAAFLARTDNVMAGAMAKPPGSDIDQCFQNPPASTEQILHPEKYWDAELFDAPHRIIIDQSKWPADWKVMKEDTLGELGLALFTRAPADRQKFSPMPKFSSQAAEGWGGDRYVLLGNGDARLLYGIASWDSAIDAQEFSKALTDLTPHLENNARALGNQSGGFALLPYPVDKRSIAYLIWSGMEQQDARDLVARSKYTITRDPMGQ